MSPEKTLHEESEPVGSSTDEAGDELKPGDFYMEGPYMVFTVQYHLRRGYCCNSDCRHCPYREASE